MKGQTPIEEYNKNLIQVIRNGVDIEEYILRNMLDEKRKQEQHTQSKVLEALEGFAKHLEKTGVFVMLDVEEYYETEVKPRYEREA
jgi:hypothetical protein